MAYGAAMTEQQPYSTVRHHPEFDLRRYPEHVLAEVEVRESFERAVQEAGLVPVAAARFARFDPPFTPAFLRRNEVVLLVSDPGAGAEPAPR